MKNVYFDSKELTNNFGYGKTREIVDSIIDKIDYNEITKENDLWENLIEAINLDLIYTEDQWQIISWYSSPNSTMSLNDAIENLINDIMNCAF